MTSLSASHFLIKVDSSEIRHLIDHAQRLLNQKNYSEGREVGLRAYAKIADNQALDAENQLLIYSILGDCSIELQDWPDARKYYEMGMQRASGSSWQAEFLNKLGHLYIRIKDFSKANPLLEQSLALRTQLYGDQDTLVADVLNNLGISYLYIGDIIKALDYQQQALRIRLANLKPDDLRIAQSYNNLGQCLDDMGESISALKALNEAKERYRRHEGSDRELADVQVNLGRVYFNADNYVAAGRDFEKALTIYKRLNDMDGMALCLNNLGNVAIQKNHLVEAGILLREALESRQQLYGNIHADVAETWFNLAYLQQEIEQYDEAIEGFEQCLNALNFDLQTDHRIEQVNSYPTLLSSLYLLARVYYAKYLETGHLQSMEKALLYLSYADETLDYLRVRYEALGSKFNLVSIGHDIYELAIDLLNEMQNRSGEERYWHQAFRYSEKSKGLLLLDGIYRSKADAFGEVPKSKLKEIQDLENSIVELEKEKYLYDPAFADNRIPLDSLNILIFQKKELFNRVLRDIRQNYSKYYELRYENPIPSVPEIQQTLLDTSQTLVEYFVGSNINIFILNRDRFDVIQVPRYTDFEILLDTIIPLIRRFRSESTAKLKQNSEAYAAAAYRLYQYLIAPLEDLIKRQLIVVPDDRLGYLPFDALLTAKVDSVMNFREHPYLIRRHSISYNFSASILAEMSQGSSDGYSNQYVGFAPEFDGMESQGLHKLLFNEQEIEKASDLLNGEIFVGKEATKNNFLRVQREYGVIHLATHGKVNVGDDDFSFLAFSKGSASQEEDYLLYLKEIYNLQMQARMVILSACETGTGHLFRGEGISSIARGFSYAGARSLVATRWSVNDKTTSQLVETFLNEIKQGRQKDLALRSAILNYIDRQNSFYAHPFFWSSFMLMGDSEVLELDEGLPWKRILLMALGIIIILYLLKSISKNKRGF